MSAFLWIKSKRELAERIDFVLAMRLAMNATSESFKTTLGDWARKAEINLRFED